MVFLHFITFSFPFSYLILRMRSQTWWRFYFRGKNFSKMCLNMYWSVKAPWHRPCMGVARSELWAPDSSREYIMRVSKSLMTQQQKQQWRRRRRLVMTTAFSAFKAYSYGDWRYSKGEILMVYIGVMKWNLNADVSPFDDNNDANR